MKKYFQLLVEGKQDGDWHEGYFADLKKTITPYGGIFNGKYLVQGETGKIVTTGPTDSQHYGIVLSNLGQFGFQSPQHMADTVNAHNANNPNYKPLTGTSILSETEGFGPVFDYLKDHGWAHVTQQASNIRPTTYIRTANHADAQSAMSVIKDQLLPEVSIETKTHVSELRSRQEIEHYMTSPDPSALKYITSRKPTTETRQPTDAERYATDAIIRKTVPESQRSFESFTFSKLRTQLNEEHKDLIREMHPIMFIHTDPTFPTYHVVAGETNRQTHDELAKDAIENHYNKKPSGNLSDQLLSLGPWTRIHTYPAPRVLGSLGQKSFEIEAASHETLRDTLGRIEPHISGHKVHIAVGDWSRRVDAEQLRDYIKHGHQTHSLRVESWQEYDAKVGETNTSLFEPGNTKFNMKAFLKKLRKKNRVAVNLPGEN